MNIKLIASFAAGILLSGQALANEPVPTGEDGINAPSAQVLPKDQERIQPIRLRNLPDEKVEASLEGDQAAVGRMDDRRDT